MPKIGPHPSEQRVSIGEVNIQAIGLERSIVYGLRAIAHNEGCRVNTSAAEANR
jgi:hypothetical protein